MAAIAEEKNESQFNGNAFLRLLGYMKPYRRQVFFSLVLALLITGFELYRPMLIGDAIDNYIEAYNVPYAVVEESDLYFEGEYLSKEKTDATRYAQLLMVEDDYYYFHDLDRSQSDALYELSQSNITADEVGEDTIMVSGITGRKLTQAQLQVLRAGDFHGIMRIGILYLMILVLNLGAAFGQTWLLQRMGQNIIFSLREDLFHHIHSLPLRFFDTRPVGRIVTRVTNDVESLHEMFAVILIRLFKNAVKIGGLALVMLHMHLRMALYSFLLIPLIALLTVMFKKISRRVHREIRTKISLLNSFLAEHISGMRLIQIFANEKMKYDEFAVKNNELYRANLKQLSVFAIFRPLIYFLSQLAFVIVLYLGSKNVLDQTITLGILYVFVSYIGNIFEPIQDLAEQFSTLQNALASAEKIFTILDEENTISERKDAIALGEVKGKIEFRHVWFAYEHEDYVLRDVSFIIHPGERVAFVGATGAGKSSILNLIGRYYEIQKGQILIDDVDIRELRIADIRAAIGQMQQDVFIFTGTIAGNIRLLNTEIDDETIRSAARIVNAAPFIEQLPHGYEEAVSERGSTLSAGQRQLLSFARTLAFDPKILVMDEATANIDTESEQLIQQALERLMEGRTTIMVAHRLSTIQHADNIIVMHQGKIRESGTHQQLLQQDGMYKKLYDLQLYAM